MEITQMHNKESILNLLYIHMGKNIQPSYTYKNIHQNGFQRILNNIEIFMIKDKGKHRIENGCAVITLTISFVDKLMYREKNRRL